jgi:hypothetical protein
VPEFHPQLKYYLITPESQSIGKEGYELFVSQVSVTWTVAMKLQGFGLWRPVK